MPVITCCSVVRKCTCRVVNNTCVSCTCLHKAFITRCVRDNIVKTTGVQQNTCNLVLCNSSYCKNNNHGMGWPLTDCTILVMPPTMYSQYLYNRYLVIGMHCLPQLSQCLAVPDSISLQGNSQFTD